MKTKSLTAIAVLASAVSPAFAQQSSSGSGVGVAVGIFLPSSSQLRNDLGSQFLTFGLSGTSTGRPSEGSITPEYSLIFANGNGNKLFILPFTYGYEYHFGIGAGKKILPYVRPFLGVAYYDYSITDLTTGIHQASKQLGGTYGLEAGIIFG